MPETSSYETERHRPSTSPVNPSRMPVTSASRSRIPFLTTARITAFRPGPSPPPVSRPSRSLRRAMREVIEPAASLITGYSMSALLWFAAALLAQEPATLDALMARHKEAAQKAKTFDELTASARSTLAAVLKLLEAKPDAATAARARAIASDICADLEDYDGAEAHAKAFLETWPKHAQAPMIKLNLGQVRTAAGRDAAARESFQSLISDHPQDDFVPEAR